MTRAQAAAGLAESAFNFERDADTRLIKDAYYDTSLEGYTAAETLLHDLGGFDHIDLIGRTRKAMQLSHIVSLRKHNPLSFLALAATGTAASRPRWRISTAGTPAPTCSGSRRSGSRCWSTASRCPRAATSRTTASRWSASPTGEQAPVDNLRVFDEPDPDLAKLCYKRLQRRRHVDTMAFPEFESYLHEERMRSFRRASATSSRTSGSRALG